MLSLLLQFANVFFFIFFFIIVCRTMHMLNGNFKPYGINMGEKSTIFLNI